MKLEFKLRNAVISKDKNALDEVFSLIYKEYHGLVAFTAYKYLNNAYDVEDIVNETFLTLFNSLNKYEIKSIKNYLVTLAKRDAINLATSKREEELVNEASSNDEMSLFIKELKEFLSEEEFELLYDYAVYDLSSKEMAKKYQKSSGAIRILIMRLKKKVKEKYKGVF